MPRYLVTWELPIVAADAEDAATKAWRFMNAPGNGVFVVIDKDGICETVDVDDIFQNAA